jgi:hypothetical protein
VTAVVLTSAAPGCEPGQPVVKSDDAGARRVPEPSETNVRALDYEIHAEGIGPYMLGASLKDTLARLPHGPRVELLQVDGVADVKLVRAERNRIVIGVRKPGGVEFLTVLDKDIARTEKEAGVGSKISEVLDKHGPAFRSRSFVSDPRIVRPKSLPGLQFIDRRGTVEAVVVTRPPPVDSARPGSKCAAGSAEIDEAKVKQLARIGDEAIISRGCFTSAEPEALVVGTGRAAVIALGDKPRRVAAWAAPGLVYARPLEIDGDDRDEVFAVMESRNGSSLTVTVDVLKVDVGRFTTLERQQVYRQESSSASWAGARLADVDILIEGRARGGLVTVSGLYVQKNLLQAEEVLPLEEVPMVVRKRRPTTPPEPAIDAGVAGPDAGKPRK